MIRTITKRLGTALFLPFMVLLLPFIALGVGIIFVNATISGLFQRARWLRALRRNGRATSAAVFLASADDGTLIIDRPGFNYKATHCWWTEDNVERLSPVPIPTDAERMDLCTRTKEMTPHEFDLWCWRRYISPETGVATLITPPHHGEAMATLLRKRLPNLSFVMSWSAVAAMYARTKDATDPKR